MRERLRPADLRFLTVCLLLLAATVWFSARYFHRAFPEASIDFRVTREQARALGEKFLSAQGLSVNGYRSASRFSYDDNAKTFLEREAGLEKANRLMGSRVRLWRWSWRWFRPLQKEEFRVDITTAGEPVGFRHEIPEAAALPSLAPDQARALAERFLREALGRSPGDLEFVEGSSIARPARTDHVFTWKQRGFNLQDADYRLEVGIQGDQPGSYREYLKIPENWQRSYERMRSRNLTAQTIDSGVMMLLAIGLLITILLRVRARDIPWRRAAAVGMVGAVLYFLSGWNSQPLGDFSYPTTDSYGSFVAQEFLRNLMGALAAAGLLFVLTAGAEPLYRRYYGSQISLGNLFRPRGLRTKRFFLGAILGVTLTGIFVAYQTGFYMVAYRFGAWSPADVPYDDLLNTRLPWLFVLFGGFLPAVSEEFLFRMFAIPFLSRLLRSVGFAIVLAGFIWGFGHAGYPQQPFWIRGVEVGVGGVALGLIMLRWGILPTLVWHYSVDALYTALLLLRSHNLYFILSGAASAGIMVLPVLVAGIAYVRRGGFEPEIGLTNADEGSNQPVPAGPEPVPAGPEASYSGWSWRRRGAALALAAGALVFVAVSHVQEFGDRPRFALGPTRARVLAEDFARAQGFQVRGCRVLVIPATEWEGGDTRLAGKYFVERRDIGFVAGMFQRELPLHSWTVRFYRALQREEMQVAVDPETGRVFEFHHVLPEDQPGADLSEPAARQVAAVFLSARGYDIQRMQAKETRSDKKKARRDYTFEWEPPPGDRRNLDEAHFRVRAQVAGDRVSSFSTRWKLPETFERAMSQRNALSNVLLVLRLVVSASLLVLAVWLLIDRTRRHAVRWRAAAWVALPFALVALAGMFLQFPLLFSQYNTAIPLQTFEVVIVTGLAVSALALFVALAAGAALILGLLPDALSALGRAGRGLLGLDALYAAGVAVVLAAALDRFRWILIDRFHAQALLSAAPRTSFGTMSPAAAAVARACQETLFWLALLALIGYAATWMRGRPWALALAALAGAAAFVPAGVHNPGEFLLYFAIMLAYIAAAFVFVRWFARANYLAYVFAVWALALAGSAAELLAQPAPALRLHGGVLIAVLLGTLLWAAAPALRRRKLSTMVVRDSR